MTEVPFVAVGFGEEPPWGDDRSCPVCGEPNLPLADSEPPGLHFIEHCGQAWIRGPIDLPVPPGPSYEPKAVLDLAAFSDALEALEERVRLLEERDG